MDNIKMCMSNLNINLLLINVSSLFYKNLFNQ